LTAASHLDSSGLPEIPTFSECVIGYRVWGADAERQLWPLYSTRRPWLPGLNTARCNCRTSNSLRFEWFWHEGRRVLEPVPDHAAPDPDCECGLYSWRRPDRSWFTQLYLSAPPRVVGAVASWGHIQVHGRGFRAEHACVVTLAYHEEMRAVGRAALQRIADRYRVELVPMRELEQAASRHGSPLPDTLRPPDPVPVPEQEPPAHDEVKRAPDASPDDLPRF
jgi:hypothetical protein